MRRALFLGLLAACQGGPPPADVETVLVEAERLLAAGASTEALELLAQRSTGEFPRALQPRYEMALARAQAGEGQLWEAFETIRDFPDDHPHSPLRDQVVALQFELGRTLVRTGRGFLFFWSDRVGGRTCLEHLVTRYPDSPYLADALRILGELDYEDGDYQLAQERFRELLRKRPESEWAPFARFRFAMSIVAELRGSDYDLDQMMHATREMQAFLENPPENPEFVREAEAALQRLLRWQAERHLSIADFYRRVGNERGELVHLERAAAPEFAATDAAATARRRLADLGHAVEVGPPLPAPAPGDGR